MTTDFDSFDQSPAGGFEESPFGARNRVANNVLAMIFIDFACQGGETGDPNFSGYLDQFCVENPGNTSVFDADRFAFRRMRRLVYTEQSRQLHVGFVHIPDREIIGGTLSYKPVVPPSRFSSTFEGESPEIHYKQTPTRPADLTTMQTLFLSLEDMLGGEDFALQLIIYGSKPPPFSIVDPILTDRFLPWLRERGVTFRQRIHFDHRWWFRPTTAALSLD